MISLFSLPTVTIIRQWLGPVEFADEYHLAQSRETPSEE
jgi:hypothetical protein